MGLNSLTVTRQRRDCDLNLNPGPSAPESSTLTTRLPSHPFLSITYIKLLPTVDLRAEVNATPAHDSVNRSVRAGDVMMTSCDTALRHEHFLLTSPGNLPTDESHTKCLHRFPRSH